MARGVQSKGDLTVALKRFCCNNQEDNRMKSSSQINERAFREIYLKAFKSVVQDAKPGCIMSSYNKINGEYVNRAPALLIGLLRESWGFDGVIMTDWQSVAKGQAEATKVIGAESDLMMPGDNDQYKQLRRALKDKRRSRSRSHATAAQK